ncbi:MAG: hypothetical protein H7144_08385 [Burkholderiales bacterium]|nr:hypothetical protein [Phycisphaerae bacterium]
MASLNIRLTPDDSRAVAELRAENVNVSELLRKALHDAAGKRRKKKIIWNKARVDALFAKLDAMSEGAPVPEYIREGIDTTDRHAMSAYMRRKLSKKLGKLANFE